MTTRSWQDNAHEFGVLSKQGFGVRLAILVACSVQPADRGRPAKSPSRGITAPKANIGAFAKAAKVGETTVSRYLDKWDRMVAAGWDLDRTSLTPEMAETLTVTDKFITEFETLATSGRSGLTGKAADIAGNTTAMAEAIKADSKTAEAALQALTEREPTGPRILPSPGSQEELERNQINYARRIIKDPVKAKEVFREPATREAASRAERDAVVEEHEARERDAAMADPERHSRGVESVESGRRARLALEFRQMIFHARQDLLGAAERWQQVGVPMDGDHREDLLDLIDGVVNAATLIREAVASDTTFDESLAALLSEGEQA